MTSRRTVAVIAIGCASIAACSRTESSSTTSAAWSFDGAAWKPPTDSELPTDSLGKSIRRGHALVMHTSDSLPAFAPGRINCTNCHMDGGRRADAAPLTGSFVRFPKYMDRTGAVVGIADRVNYCFTRSLAGTKLPTDSREMQDIVAYIAWLSRGIPVGDGMKVAGAAGIPKMAQELEGDTTRGKSVFAGKCAACHQLTGEGNPAIPPGVPALWGPKSFSVGASMARRSKAASFIWHNMPYGAGKTLSPQEAYDVAAYVTSQPRPDSPGKERDWPVGGAPADVPYPTRGHVAYLPPPVLTRANPAGAIVEVPRSVGVRRQQ